MINKATCSKCGRPLINSEKIMCPACKSGFNYHIKTKLIPRLLLLAAALSLYIYWIN